MELWRPIPSFPDYEASDLGGIRRLKPALGTAVGLVLSQAMDRKGYKTTVLFKSGKRHPVRVHKYIAETFIGPMPVEKTQIAHFDGDPGNNRVDNLRYATQEENRQDSLRHGTNPNGISFPQAKMTDYSVRKMREMRKSGYSIISLSREFGISSANASHICNRRAWKHIV